MRHPASLLFRGPVLSTAGPAVKLTYPLAPGAVLRADGRTERLVNPVAWERGMVIAQCAHCEAWHKLADAANLVEEIRYAELEDE